MYKFHIQQDLVSVRDLKLIWCNQFESQFGWLMKMIQSFFLKRIKSIKVLVYILFLEPVNWRGSQLLRHIQWGQRRAKPLQVCVTVDRSDWPSQRWFSTKYCFFVYHTSEKKGFSLFCLVFVSGFDDLNDYYLKFKVKFLVNFYLNLKIMKKFNVLKKIFLLLFKYILSGI